METHKFCPMCKSDKPLADFSSNSQNKKWGLSTYCKPCVKKRQKAATDAGKPVRGRYDNPIPLVDKKVCGRCRKTKSAADYNKNRRTSTGLSEYCRVCLKLTR